MVAGRPASFRPGHCYCLRTCSYYASIGPEGPSSLVVVAGLRGETATAITKTTAQATGIARASGAIGLKFLTIHVTPNPSGMAAVATHSQNVQFGIAGSLLCPIAEA